jgi:hypothetical protein
LTGARSSRRKRATDWRVGSAGCGPGARWGERLAPGAKAADSIEKHLEVSLAHWTAGGWLSTGFLEGLNSVFSAVKRKARGYRSGGRRTTLIYFVTGKLKLPSLCPGHAKQRGTDSERAAKRLP